MGEGAKETDSQKREAMMCSGNLSMEIAAALSDSPFFSSR